jgi:NosR/NirI family nitrous oxide reductase transcriptional regulator
MINMGMLKRLITVIALGVILCALGYQQSLDKMDTLKTLQQIDGRIHSFQQVKGRFPAYSVTDSNGELIGYAVLASASGYGGPVMTGSLIDTEGTIKKTAVIRHFETPLYFSKVTAAGYPENLQATEIRHFPVYGQDIDGVSGATLTAKAIVKSVELGSSQIGIEQLDLDLVPPPALEWRWEEVAAVILTGTAVVVTMLGLTKLRPLLLILSVLLTGFLLNASLNLGNLVTAISGNWPSFGERPLWFVLVLGIPLTTILLRKNYYCTSLCPFGAVQEGIYKGLSLASYNPPHSILNKVRVWRWILLWMAIVLALFSNHSSIAGYEPFTTFFDGSGNSAQWIVLLLVLLMSVGIFRIWCRCFCPVGAILDLLSKARSSVFQKKFQHDNRMKNRECLNCGGTHAKLSSGDLLFIVLAVLINGLLILALLLNAKALS